MQSSIGINYVTLNHAETTKLITEKCFAFQQSLQEVGNLVLSLKFYEPLRQKSFFGVSEQKVVWEEWVIPVEIATEYDIEKVKKRIKSRVIDIVNAINECQHQLKPIGELEDPQIIRYPFEISWPEEKSSWNLFG